MEWPKDGFTLNTAEPRQLIDLADLVTRYRIEARVFDFDRDPRRTRPFEPFPFGPVQKMDKANFEQEIIARLSGIKGAFRDDSGQAPQIVMVVYSRTVEFDAMERIFPGVAPYISRWADANKFTKNVGLRDAMFGLGFHAEYYHTYTRTKHSPGMDAVRTLGVLVEFFSRPSALEIDFRRMTPEERQSRNSQRAVDGVDNLELRLSQLPYTVMLNFHDDRKYEPTPIPAELESSRKLLKFLRGSSVEPTLVGIVDIKAKSETSELDDSDGASKNISKTIGQTGYACFLNEELAVRFMEWDGREIYGKKLTLARADNHIDLEAARAGSWIFAKGAFTILDKKETPRTHARIKDMAEDPEFIMPSWLE